MTSPTPSAPVPASKRAVRRREPRLAQNSFGRSLSDFLSLIFGVALVAATFNTLLAPNSLASGGVIGLSLVGAKLLRIEPALIH